MAFNHYAKLKAILKEEEPGWFIKRIDQPTSSKNFKGETTHFPHYYRLFRNDGTQIKYGKFQQLERLARILEIPAEELPVI